MIYLNVELRGISLRWTISKLRKIKTRLFKKIYKFFYEDANFFLNDNNLKFVSHFENID
jgi:hypothetical protein